ncbi:MAG TPA: aminotransferase class III-fold pyridoxal phosphate-dependent enzyme, partial [Nitrospira sp.]|nr:aminotransferase class III-fold pyridoxal phosphate-dependent enzyme [Nitrospira sp.]
MSKTVCIIQARLGSTRFPGKVLKDLAGKPVLAWVVEAAQRAQGVDLVIVATSKLKQDDLIVKWCDRNRIQVFRGSETDVLDRFYQCAKKYNATVVIRLTADCPFLDYNVISDVVNLRRMANAEYASNIDPPTYPDGLDVECFNFSALECAWSEATRASDRDCVPQYIVRNRDRFPAANLTCPLPGLASERWVLDTEEDYLFCQALAKLMRMHSKTYQNILGVLKRNPKLRDLNKMWTRNERFYEHVSTENLPPRTYQRSDHQLIRALRTIPFGSQTFSKSHVQFPASQAPLYVTHADGCRIFDVDGNDYVDMVSAIMPVVLGYRDPDVDLAIRRQLDKGIIFSLATKEEAELAELLCHHIPCAEMVKFGKSGTDATSAAVRLARAYTGRDHILVGGYHGWADWSMAVSNRSAGIPARVKEMSHQLSGYDGDPRHVAAVIVEPNDDPEYLKEVREYCTKNHIILIFDEIITGFR